MDYSFDPLSKQLQFSPQAPPPILSGFITTKSSSLSPVTLDRSKQSNAEESKSSFKLIPVAEIMQRSLETDWLVKGYLPADSTAMFFGAPKSGKSLVALEIAYCIGLGIDYYGSPTKQSSVIYIAGEGKWGITKRLKALALVKGNEPEGIFVSDCAMDIYSAGSTAQVIQAIDSIPSVSLIIIDTFNRNFSGDENSAKDIATMMQNSDRLREATGASILIVHHTGHEASRARGSSAISAALDVEYKISKSKSNLVSMRNTNAKDIEPPPDIHFSLNAVVVKRSTGGEEFKAPVLVQGDATAPTTKLTADDHLLLMHLRQLSSSGDIASEDFVDIEGSPASIDSEQHMVCKASWFTACQDDIKVRDDCKDPGEAKRKRFDRSHKHLYELGKVAKNPSDFFIITDSANT